MTKVLVIDDDHDVANSFAMLIECVAPTATVKISYSGPDGIEEAVKFLPDIIFLDIGMPGMDGCQTATKIRELPQGNTFWIAAISGYEARHIGRDMLLSGAFDSYMIKPAMPEAIIALLEDSKNKNL